jgi:hypothetical protein
LFVGLDEEGELHQYVVYEKTKSKGPKVIKLDDPKGKNADIEKYTPPTSLTVHLSKIDMPELKPRANSQPPDKNIMKEWERKAKEREREGGKGNEKSKEKEKGKEKGKEKEKEGEKGKGKEKATKKGGRVEDDIPPGTSYPIPPAIPQHSRPTSNMWVQNPSQYNQPLYQQPPGALNTGEPPQPPPQLSSVVSNLIGRLDWLARR